MPNYLSKVIIDNTEALIKDSEARNSINSINAKINTIINGDKNSDITTQLQNALDNGNAEIIGGPYTINSTINVPRDHVLNGNGSIINTSSDFNGTWALTTGTINGDWKTPERERQAIKNLTINCNYLCSGINLFDRGSELEDCTILNPSTNGMGIACRFGLSDDNAGSIPGDMDIINCAVLVKDVDNNFDKHHNAGIFINASDVTINNVRTLGSLVGVDVTNHAGMPIMNNVHPLAFRSDTDNSWSDSIGFNIRRTAFMNDCYSDNFRYGIFLHDGAAVFGTNFYSQFFELNKNIDRYAVYSDTDTINLNIKNIYVDVNSTRCVGSSVPIDQQEFCHAFFTTHYSDNSVASWYPDDYGRLISKNGNHYWVSGGSGEKEKTFAIISPFNKTLTTSTQCCPPVKVDIITSQFAIRGMIIKQTSGAHVSVYDWGTFIPSKTEIASGTTAGVTVKQYEDNGIVYYTLSEPINCHYWQIDVYADQTLLFLPSTPIEKSGSLIQSHTYSVTQN